MNAKDKLVVVEEIGAQVMEALKLRGLSVRSISLNLEPGAMVEVHVSAFITHEQLDILISSLKPKET